MTAGDPIPCTESRSSLAQNPDVTPFLAGNGRHPDRFTHASEHSPPDAGALSAVLPPRTLSRSDTHRAANRDQTQRPQTRNI